MAMLRSGFVNCWLLAKDLEAIAARDGSEDLASLCKLLRANYGYPVDSVLVTKDLASVGHTNVAGSVAVDPVAYSVFLNAGLEAAGRAVVALSVEPAELPQQAAARRPPTSVIGPGQPDPVLLEIVRRRGFGRPSVVFFPIDAEAFTAGGVIDIDVRVGRGGFAITFELCAMTEVAGDRQTAGGRRRVMQPVQARTVDANGKATLSHVFAAGGQFGLAVRPTHGGIEGETAAVHALVRSRGL